MPPEKEFLISDLAKFLEVNPRTIKNWENEGKIPKARRNKFGWRVYTQAEMEAIKKLAEDNRYWVEVRNQ